MKLYIKSDTIYGYVPLASKPISESTVSSLGTFMNKVNNIIPVQTPGSFTVATVTYKVYQGQALTSYEPTLSTKKTFTSIAEGDEIGDEKGDEKGNEISKTVQSRTISTSPLTFSSSELLNLVDILTVLAQHSHTHSKKDDKAIDVTATGDLSAKVINKCDHCNLGSNPHFTNGWLWQ